VDRKGILGQQLGVYRPDVLRFRTLDPFPARARVTLVTKTFIAISSAATQFTLGTELVFNLNSLFNPITGQPQPYGFDSMTPLYSRYKVDGVKATFRFLKSNLPAVQLCGIGVAVSPASSYTQSATTVAVAADKPNTSVVPFLGHTDVDVPENQSWQVKFRIADLAGLDKKEFDANVEEYAALCTASPTRIAKYLVALANISDANAYTEYLHYCIEYDCEFYDRIVLAQS